MSAQSAYRNNGIDGCPDAPTPLRRAFRHGVVAGAVIALVLGLGALYLLNMSDVIAVSVMQVPGVQESLNWAHRNLGLSLIPFALALFLYLHGLLRLARLVGRSGPPEEVAHADQLVDIWTALFFGIGVLWTAIGMRDALIHALGDPGEAARAGAFAILQRLVDGGILVALSTTIFGGIGGYLMRVLKALTVGATLKRYYTQIARAQGDAIHNTLLEIARSLTHLQASQPRDGGGEHVQSPLGQSARHSR